jgi:hypothetical protein
MLNADSGIDNGARRTEKRGLTVVGKGITASHPCAFFPEGKGEARRGAARGKAARPAVAPYRKEERGGEGIGMGGQTKEWERCQN